VFIFLPAHKFRAAQYFADLAEKKKKKLGGNFLIFWVVCVSVCRIRERHLIFLCKPDTYIPSAYIVTSVSSPAVVLMPFGYATLFE
jgi:hypothetical protein